MRYELWTFREKQAFLAEWKEVLREADGEKLRLILKEILLQGGRCECNAYTEVAEALLTHFDLIPVLQKRLDKGSDLSVTSFSALLRGERI